MAQPTHREHSFCGQPKFCKALHSYNGWRWKQCPGNTCLPANQYWLYKVQLWPSTSTWNPGAGSPLAWYFESDSEAEMQCIYHPVLRTLQETFIRSATFKATCFPCPVGDKPWTLLHAVCTFVKGPSTAHICGSFPKRERIWRMFRWAHKPWVWNEITNEYFYINNPPAKWKCHFFHRKRQRFNYWTTGKRWFLEPITPKWSFILRAGLDIGEIGWLLSYDGAWMMNKITDEFFLTKKGFSQSITMANGPSQWRQGTCSDQKGNWVRYWFSGN